MSPLGDLFLSVCGDGCFNLYTLITQCVQVCSLTQSHTVQSYLAR